MESGVWRDQCSGKWQSVKRWSGNVESRETGECGGESEGGKRRIERRRVE